MKHRQTDRQRQGGFSLVELMIAMVVGLLITLGAGQLFLIGLQNFRQVELLGNKQAALTFAAEMVIRDIRRADNDRIVVRDNGNTASGDDKELELVFNDASGTDGCNPGEEVMRTYYVSADKVSESEGWSLILKQQCGSGSVNTEPLVTGFGPGGFDVDDTEGGSGVYVVTFCLISEPGDSSCEPVTFHAINRTAAVTG